MSNPKKTHELIRQNEQIVKKSQKHDANLQKNSVLYFQVGLIVCLIAAYGLFEMKFETTILDYGERFPPDDPTMIAVQNFKIYEEPAPDSEPKQIEKKVVLTNTPKIVEDDFKLKKLTKVITSEQNITSDKPVDPSSINIIAPPESNDVPYNFVEQVPIYPGCEKSKNNTERRQCMSEKISKLIRRKFNDNIASDYGLSGRQRINVQFKIDKMGHVTDIKTHAQHPSLKKEAERVINKIPEMIPGKQSNKAVGVIYTLPIIFQVN